MPYRHEETYFPNSGSKVLSSYLDLYWETSPRDQHGKLQLRSNPHTRNRGVCTGYTFGPTKWATSGCNSGLSDLKLSLYNSLMSSVHAECYARFRGKLYEGSAALGVTAAGYKQSADMIRKRSKHLTESATEVALRAASMRPKKAADLYLESIFGWIPLVSDMHSAATSVIQMADHRSFVRGTSSRGFQFLDGRPSWDWGFQNRSSGEGLLRMSMSAQVTIKNPNLWLLERAGLLNPASVAWDLVPWSFVVNMFSNVGQLVNSITDFVGLEFANECTVTSQRGVYMFGTGYINDHSEYHWVNNQKTQSLGAPPRPPLVFKLPDVSWETAAMAASLFTQQLGRIVKGFKAVNVKLGVDISSHTQ